MGGVEPKLIYEKTLTGNYYGISPDGSCYAIVNHTKKSNNLIIVKIDNIPALVTIFPSNKYAACYICYDSEEKDCKIFIVDLNKDSVIKSWKSNAIQAMVFTSDTSFVTLDSDGLFKLYSNFVGDEITIIEEKDSKYFDMCYNG